MPLYEYQCNSCHHRFELIQRFSDPPAHACPECGGPVTKLLSSPAIQFKGSGWYITDYARKGGKDTNGAKPKDAAKPADTANSSSDGATSTTASPSEAGSTTESKAKD